jgi:hypothetical protein
MTSKKNTLLFIFFGSNKEKVTIAYKKTMRNLQSYKTTACREDNAAKER